MPWLPPDWPLRYCKIILLSTVTATNEKFPWGFLGAKFDSLEQIIRESVQHQPAAPMFATFQPSPTALDQRPSHYKTQTLLKNMYCSHVIFNGIGIPPYSIIFICEWVHNVSGTLLMQASFVYTPKSTFMFPSLRYYFLSSSGLKKYYYYSQGQIFRLCYLPL